jgi:hypothetical protein
MPFPRSGLPAESGRSREAAYEFPSAAAMFVSARSTSLREVARFIRM